MNRFRPALLVLCTLSACASSGFENLSALAAKPALPFSVMVSGGAYVGQMSAPFGVEGDELPSTFGASENPEPAEPAVALTEICRMLRRANVFVELRQDPDAASSSRALATIDERVTGATPELRAASDRARAGAHDFVLVVEQLLDGPVENRGVNDRWPFTIGAWLFALGAFIPDRTFESKARLRLSIRDAYSGRRVFGPILVEPGPVELNMWDRCGLWGFTQSLLVPPFWTTSSVPRLSASMRALTAERLLVAAVRRLKSADVLDRLRRSGPAVVDLEPTADRCGIRTSAAEPVGAVAVRFDGREWEGALASAFAARFLGSEQRVGDVYRYAASCTVPEGAAQIQVLVETTAARISSSTQKVPGR